VSYRRNLYRFTSEPLTMAIKQIRISEVKMADWVLLSMETESAA
jgi:hypothetical protein